MKIRVRWGAAAAVATVFALAIGFTTGAGAGFGQLRTPVKSPGQGKFVRYIVQVSGAWRNGKGYIIRQRARVVIVDNGTEEQFPDPDPAIAAAAPAYDAALDRPMTPAEDAAFSAAINSEHARFLPPGLRDPLRAEGTPARDVWAGFTLPPIEKAVTVWEPPPGLR